jgi:hypothetical protein
MRAGQPFTCNTPASKVEAQLFEGSNPTLLEFDYKKEVEVDMWEGISGYYDFELHVNGDITAWRSYQVGKGKRFAKTDLDTKYKHGTTQPSTGAIFVADVGKSNQDFQPKLEMSNRRKRQLKVDKAETSVARKKAKMDVSKAAQHKLDHARQLPSSGDTTAENISTETASVFVSPSTVPVSPNPAERHQRWLLMGHGLSQFRFVMLLDDESRRLWRKGSKRAATERACSKWLKSVVRSFQSCWPHPCTM